MNTDPEIWGPAYWRFMHSVSLSYPETPTQTDKKCVYELFTNLPRWIPHDKSRLLFSHMLDMYPITAYLDSRTALVTWVHYVHNRVNDALDKPQLSMAEFRTQYLRPKQGLFVDRKHQRLVGFLAIALALVGVGAGLSRC